MKTTFLIPSLLLALLASAWAQAPIIIKITGTGNSARFVVDGAPGIDPVITPGQTVRWVNEDPNTRHSARSMATNQGGQRIFDTRFIAVGAGSEVVFDADKFQMAGVPSGGELRMEYQCEIHHGMRGFLKLKANGTHTPMPAPTPSGSVFTFDAISEGSDQIFRPKQLVVLLEGDEIVWRNADVPNPGLHALSFTNWAQDKEFLEVVSSEADFDATTGKTKEESDRRGLVFLRAKLVKLPANRNATIDFFCTVHGADMKGQIAFQEKTEVKTVPMPVYQVPAAPLAAFDAVRIGEKLADSYFAMSVDINGDGRKDIVTSGLGRPGISLAEVDWYENPTWQRHVIGRFDVPVALDAADVDGDGNTDLAICYDYGLCIIDCKPGNGTIGWLRNPGVLQDDPEWKVYPIGKLMATHRLHFGHFSKTDGLGPAQK